MGHRCGRVGPGSRPGRGDGRRRSRSTDGSERRGRRRGQRRRGGRGLVAGRPRRARGGRVPDRRRVPGPHRAWGPRRRRRGPSGGRPGRRRRRPARARLRARRCGGSVPVPAEARTAWASATGRTPRVLGSPAAGASGVASSWSSACVLASPGSGVPATFPAAGTVAEAPPAGVSPAGVAAAGVSSAASGTGAAGCPSICRISARKSPPAAPVEPAAPAVAPECAPPVGTAAPSGPAGVTTAPTGRARSGRSSGSPGTAGCRRTAARHRARRCRPRGPGRGGRTGRAGSCSRRAAPSTAWLGSKGSPTPRPAAVAGISCIRPWAPAGLTAPASYPDSWWATAASREAFTSYFASGGVEEVGVRRGGRHPPRDVTHRSDRGVGQDPPDRGRGLVDTATTRTARPGRGASIIWLSPM